MDHETENALAIAELKGAIKAQRAENDAMESRIDTSLAQMREDMAKRETRLILAVAVIVGVGLTIFGFLTVPPS